MNRTRPRFTTLALNIKFCGTLKDPLCEGVGGVNSLFYSFCGGLFTPPQSIVTHSFITCTLLRHITKPSGKSPPTRVVNILSDPLSSTLLRDKSLEGSGSIIIIITIIIIIIIFFKKNNDRKNFIDNNANH